MNRVGEIRYIRFDKWDSYQLNIRSLPEKMTGCSQKKEMVDYNRTPRLTHFALIITTVS